MKAYGGVDVYIYVFFTSALVGLVLRFTPLPLYSLEKSLGTHWIGDWMGPRTGLDDVEN
jgi:hypothetical protein